MTPRRWLWPALAAAALAAVAVAAWLVPGLLFAPVLRFGLPIDCTPGSDCAVQNYVDHDPGPATRDFACGWLTYDGHKGTDFRLPDMAAIAGNVAVVAAADGTVLRVRDGMPDISIRDPAASSVAGREAGNSVIIDHGGGWETQYGHLREGSVAVAAGAPVRAGTPVGAVGLSGDTEFPHLHFEVRHEGRTVDPFVGDGNGAECGQAGQPLWTDETAALLAYRPTGLLAFGFAAAAPDADGIRQGRYRDAQVTPESPVIALWASLYGTRPDDRQTFRLEGPDGAMLLESSSDVPGPKAEWLAWAGRPRGAGPWPAGRYVGTYRLVRGGQVIVEARESVDVR